MVITTIQSNQLYLPEPIATRLKGSALEIVETKEGVLLKPVKDVISLAKGCLKGFGFSSERLMQLKQEEKELER